MKRKSLGVRTGCYYTELHRFKQSVSPSIMEDNEIVNLKLGASIEVHNALGHGLLESSYQECFFFELQNKGLKVGKEVALPIVYKEVSLHYGYRIDLLIKERIILKQKAVACFTDVHFAQIPTYFKSRELRFRPFNQFL